MDIVLNKVVVKIDGKDYQFYKLNLGFNRELIELQSDLNKMTNQLAKKYNIEVSQIDSCPDVTPAEQLDIAKLNLQMSNSMKKLLVDPKDSGIIDKLDSSNISELITALK